jgi:CheY-like chemotaxis protein
MSPEKAQILIVDDEPHNLLILQDILEELGGDLTSASSGEAALAALEPEPERFDVVVLDRMMPGMDGVQCIARMKAHPQLATIPVIMQTAAATKEDVMSGIAAGAYYYLTKPFEAEMLLTMVRTALDDRRRFRLLQRRMVGKSGAMLTLQRGLFVIRSLDEAEALAGSLSQLGDNPPMLAMGLSELLWNAIEHGNLGITYDQKAQLVREGRWAAEVQARLGRSEHRDKWVEVALERRDGEVRFTVKDQGPGFDWRPFLELNLERAFHVNGRGIAMANSLCFDRLEYQGSGNQVLGIVHAKSDAA